MPKPEPTPTPEPTPNPIPFPDATEVFASCRYLLTPAKDRPGTTAERTVYAREARSVVAYAFVAVDSKQPAPWVGWSVTMDNGSTQPLGRLVRILATGAERGLGRPIACRHAD